MCTTTRDLSIAHSFTSVIVIYIFMGVVLFWSKKTLSKFGTEEVGEQEKNEVSEKMHHKK